MIDYSKFRNFKPSYSAGERMALPVGIYEGHIIKAAVEYIQNVGQALMIYVDIDKGEYTGYYRKQYESQTGEKQNIRYKGVYRIILPDGQNEQHDNWRQHQLEGAIWALENGNPGFKWDWEEEKLKGLKVGLNVREREYYVNKKFGVTTEIGRLESVAMINSPDESKRPKPMKKRELSDRDKKKREQDEANEASGFVEVTDEKLPF